MGKIDTTKGGESQSVKKHPIFGHGENTPEKIALRMAQLQEKLTGNHETEPVNDKIFDGLSSVSLSQSEKRAVIGGEVKDPKIQNERIKKMLAEINELRLENESLVEEKEVLSANLLEISKILDKAGIKIKGGEIIETKKSEYTPSGTALRPSYATKNRKVENTTPNTTEERITNVTETKKPQTLRSSNVVRLPTRKSSPEVEQPKETLPEKAAIGADEVPIHDFLHPDKFSEAINAVHKINEGDVVTRIDEAIEAEPFLPPEESVTAENQSTTEVVVADTTPVVENLTEKEPEPLTLDAKTGNVIYLKKTKLEQLAGITDLVNSIFKNSENDPVMLASFATGKLVS